ncbi:iron-siderophore ABC transporter substrate-binding protein [Labedella endophytica]|uniref:Iron-siderophore ABC transporter substrate-binding protein n=1 Tax=Labedella endophytica TaxID=1523160 RepID=A0A3S0VBR7_9MICO|nr:iron-siderophore ABC transporter substrate-binding protein [Labedella endophytica]RUR01774.1 iron-siderophore ABC transporter substrate-binding protein [Labedella endophytica]
MRTSRRTLSVIALAAAGALSLSACAGGSDAPSSESSGSASSGVFPVTVDHVFGETEIDAQPQRVATIQWANQDVALALGVVPVGMSKQTYGDDDGDGILPWTYEKLEELGATDELPVLFDEASALDFEAVADTTPDVILGGYGGFTQEDYDTLSQIAPTVAYPNDPWGSTWREMTELDGKALGLESEADALIADIEKQMADAVADEPSLEGKTAMVGYFTPGDLGTIGYYSTEDSRNKFLTDFGLEMPESLIELSEENPEFYGTVSAENADTFDDVDILIVYGDETTIPSIEADPLLSQIPAVANGSVVVMDNSLPIAATLTPSPLTIPWSLDELTGMFAQAAENAE